MVYSNVNCSAKKVGFGSRGSSSFPVTLARYQKGWRTKTNFRRQFFRSQFFGVLPFPTKISHSGGRDLKWPHLPAQTSSSTSTLRTELTSRASPQRLVLAATPPTSASVRKSKPRTHATFCGESHRACMHCAALDRASPLCTTPSGDGGVE